MYYFFFIYYRCGIFEPTLLGLYKHQWAIQAQLDAYIQRETDQCRDPQIELSRQVLLSLSGMSVQTLVGHSGTVKCLHLEGNRLVSGSTDRTIKVCYIVTARQVLKNSNRSLQCSQMPTSRGKRYRDPQIGFTVRQICTHIGSFGHSEVPIHLEGNNAADNIYLMNKFCFNRTSSRTLKYKIYNNTKFIYWRKCNWSKKFF